MHGGSVGKWGEYDRLVKSWVVLCKMRTGGNVFNEGMR